MHICTILAEKIAALLNDSGATEMQQQGALAIAKTLVVLGPKSDCTILAEKAEKRSLRNSAAS